MRRALRPFLAPLVLIGLLCALLLALDPGAPGSRKGPPRVALVQHAQIAALDAGASGIVARLAERGFVDGRTVRLTRYDAQSDLATANDIARQVTGGQFDLVVTVSTLSLQTVANSNRERRVPHVFGVVTDAASAGVGVSATDPTDHPEWLTGYTSLVPAGKALALARELNPGLRKVGLVWHSSEVSSQTYTRDARAAAATLGLELLEANAENPGEVGLGARALVERGAEMFLLTGDVIVLSAAEVLIQVARDARIPVISMIPPNAKKGALADLGADYATVGREVGDRAADVLQGAVIAKLPVLNRAPLAFTLNLDALRGLRSGWSAPADVVARADVVIDQAGEHRRGAAAASPAAAVPGPARSPSPSSPPPSSVTAPSGATTDAR